MKAPSILALTLLLPASAAADDAPTCVASATRSGLPAFLARIPAVPAAALGLGSERARRAATPGEPYRLHRISLEALRRHAPGAPVDGLLAATPEWFVPVVVDARPVAFLVVEQGATGCRAVALGFADLAARVGEATGPGGAVAGGRPRLAVLPQAREYFLADPATGPRRLHSLGRGAGARPASREGERDDLDAVVLRLRAAVAPPLAAVAR